MNLKNMIISKTQRYLQKLGKASLSDLATHFNMDANALRPILQKLIRKGRIRPMESSKCTGCSHCSPEKLEWYEWINE